MTGVRRSTATSIGSRSRSRALRDGREARTAPPPCRADGRTRYAAAVTERTVVDDLDVSGELPHGVRLAGSDVGGCRFVGLELTEGSLRGSRLSDCRFERCEMTLLDVTDATMHDVVFESCRLQAVDFGALARDPIGLSVRFERCDLSLASFRGLDLRQVAFEGGRAREAVLIDADLRDVALNGLDLTGAEIRGCDLRGADLRGASGFVLSPCDNRVRGLRIDLAAVTGLLAAVGVVWE
jgi:fluoroquinolone resistance protein